MSFLKTLKVYAMTTTCTPTFFISYFPAIFSPTVRYSFVKILAEPLLLIDMQRPCVITEKRCDPHHVIANLTIFNTILRAILMHFLCQIPLTQYTYVTASYISSTLKP